MLLLTPLGAWAQRVPIVVPPEPSVKPLILSLSEMDADGNHVDDLIDNAVLDALDILEDPRATLMQRIRARASLREMIEVDIEFSRQIKLRELKEFIAAGGQVTWIYKANYGWTGRIPRANVYQLPFLMAPGCVGVVASREVVIDPPGAVGRLLSP